MGRRNRFGYNFYKVECLLMVCSVYGVGERGVEVLC